MKIARNIFIHYDEIDIDGEKEMGSFRVEDGKIHSAKLDKSNDNIEVILVGKIFKDLVT